MNENALMKTTRAEADPGLIYKPLSVLEYDVGEKGDPHWLAARRPSFARRIDSDRDGLPTATIV